MTFKASTIRRGQSCIPYDLYNIKDSKLYMIFSYVKVSQISGAVKSPSPNYMQMFYRGGITQLIDVQVTRCMLRCLMNEPYTQVWSWAVIYLQLN